MSFLERQESARRRTRFYTLQFGLLAIPCVVATFFATMCSVWLIATAFVMQLLELFVGERAMEHVVGSAGYVLVSGVLCTVLVLWVLVWKKRRQLARSADYVASELHAARIVSSTRDLAARRLHNICEEMALAAGIEPPEVYVWPRESIINALAVGHSSADAAIFVTRGALDSLTRDELQALVGYTMSQVLNGDMALNSRLAVYLYAFRFAPRVARWWLLFPFDQKGVEFLKALFSWLVFMMWVGIALTIVTWPGYLGARLLQTAIGRERQKLADASAVQFTRNPSALEATLLKTLALGSELAVIAPSVDDLAHACFAPPAKHRIFATHRPLALRIRTLNPRLVGAALEEAVRAASWRTERQDAQAEAHKSLAMRRTREARERAALIEQVAVAAAVLSPGKQGDRDAPMSGMTASGDTRALLLALLIERQPEIQKLQLDVVRRHFGDGAMLAMSQSLRALRPLTPRERTLALDTHLPALRTLPTSELRRLQATIVDIEAIDDATDVFEYVIARRTHVFIADLLAPREPHGRHRLDERAVPLGAVLSIVAQHGGNPREAREAFEAGVRRLGLARPPAFVPALQWVRPLDRALADLETLQPVAKEVLIEALNATTERDGKQTQPEAELVRTIATSLHCPQPRA